MIITISSYLFLHKGNYTYPEKCCLEKGLPEYCLPHCQSNDESLYSRYSNQNCIQDHHFSIYEVCKDARAPEKECKFTIVKFANQKVSSFFFIFAKIFLSFFIDTPLERCCLGKGVPSECLGNGCQPNMTSASQTIGDPDLCAKYTLRILECRKNKGKPRWSNIDSIEL